MKIVINTCFGGFGLSHKAIMRYAELKGIKLYYEQDEYGSLHYYKVPPEKYEKLSEECRKARNYERINEKGWYFSDSNIPRDDNTLIKVVEELKEEANETCAKLKIVEIPDNTDYVIEEYDGLEHIAEEHKTWG